MKRTFVFLLTVLTQAPFSYAQTDTPALDKKIPALQSTLSQQSDSLPANQIQKPDLLLHAQLKARQNILLASEMSGRIQRLDLRDGECFIAGQVLATISCPKAKSQLSKVRGVLTQQEQAIQQLEDMHSINTLEIDLATRERDEAKANVMLTEALVSRCVVYAPFAGKVVKRFAKPSQIVRVGDPLLEIMDNNSQDVEFLVPASEISHITLGKHYQVNLEDTTKPYQIELTGLGGRIDSETQTIKIYGRIEDAVTAALLPTENLAALGSFNH
ncbi:efflux RND transporter periplasmic adaptor subunit [Crenothrix sp.]|uniref:efflux RND transporter periplasmic adaptor subunit n=1 Tax=Crenothrix sp. TaxID=3100433 RepID=UPI00374D8BBC